MNCAPFSCEFPEDTFLTPLVYTPILWGADAPGAPGGVSMPTTFPLRLPRGLTGFVVGFKSLCSASLVGIQSLKISAQSDEFIQGLQAPTSSTPIYAEALSEIWKTKVCELCCLGLDCEIPVDSRQGMELGFTTNSVAFVSGEGIEQSISCCCCCTPVGAFGTATAAIRVVEQSACQQAAEYSDTKVSSGIPGCQYIRVPIMADALELPRGTSPAMGSVEIGLHNGYKGQIIGFRFFNCPGEFYLSSIKPAGEVLDRIQPLPAKVKKDAQKVIANSTVSVTDLSPSSDLTRALLAGMLEGVDAATFNSDTCSCWYPLDGGCIDSRTKITIGYAMGPNAGIAINAAPDSPYYDPKSATLRGELLVKLVSDSACEARRG